MISHIFMGITDFERAFGFYSAVLQELALELKFRSDEEGWAGWHAPAQPRPLFVIGRPYQGELACANGQMVALLAPNRAAVVQVHAAALAHGGRCEGAPGLRPHYHPDYYGAYFRDLDGNKLAVCCHAPEPAGA